MSRDSRYGVLVDRKAVEQALSMLKGGEPRSPMWAVCQELSRALNAPVSEIAPASDAFAREYAKDCELLARWVRPDAPTAVRSLAEGWIGDAPSERPLP